MKGRTLTVEQSMRTLEGLNVKLGRLDIDKTTLVYLIIPNQGLGNKAWGMVDYLVGQNFVASWRFEG